MIDNADTRADTPTRKPGRRSQADRRIEAERRMLDAAVTLIAREGIAALTLTDVGEAAGYSRGLPAHYFGKRDAMVAAVARHIVERYGVGLRKSKIDDTPGGLSALLAAIAFYFDSVEQDPTTMRALLALQTEAMHDPGLRDVVAALNQQAVDRFTRRLTTGVERGEIRADIDPPLRAALMLGQIRGAAAQWLLAPDRHSIGDLRDGLVAALRAELTPREGRLPQ